jgi:hypothetical protein
MAPELPWKIGVDTTNLRPTETVLDLPGQTLKPRASGITLWRPAIVLVKAGRPESMPPRVVLAEPGLRPAAILAQNDVDTTVLAELTETQRFLGVRAAAAEAQACGAPTEQGRVTAVIESYRIHAAMDVVLQRTVQQARALLEQRGLR